MYGSAWRKKPTPSSVAPTTPAAASWANSVGDLCGRVGFEYANRPNANATAPTRSNTRPSTVTMRGLYRDSPRMARTRSAGLASTHQLTPAAFAHLDVVPLGRGFDPLPGLLAFAVGDALHLIESGDGVSYVASVVERFLPLLGERKTGVAQIILLGGGHALGPSSPTRTACLLGLLDVPSGRGLLLLSGHHTLLSADAGDDARWPGPANSSLRQPVTAIPSSIASQHAPECETVVHGERLPVVVEVRQHLRLS